MHYSERVGAHGRRAGALGRAPHHGRPSQRFFLERVRAAAAHAPVCSHLARAPSRHGQLNVGSQKVVYDWGLRKKQMQKF